MKVLLSLESWDVDDPLALLFLGHYHQKGKVKLLGVVLDEGTPLQASLYGHLLKRARLDEVPLFSAGEGKESVHPYYGELLPGYEKEEAKVLPLEEAFSLLRSEDFHLLVGGSLSFANALLKEGIKPLSAVVQGGFAGPNVTGRRNEKFGERLFMPSFNLNKDLKATLEFFERRRAFPLYLVSKNVNHLLLVEEKELPSFSDTPSGRVFLELLRRYLKKVRPKKSLHDVYASLALLDKKLFEWKEVRPLHRRGKKRVLWGSEPAKSNAYITVSASPRLKDYALLKEEVSQLNQLL